MSGGSGSPKQRSKLTGQRVLKLQPVGGLAGLGRSPEMMMRCRFSSTIGSGHWHSREQGLRIGMLRIVVDIVNWAQLDDFAQIHHSDAIADMPHHAEVMRDEEIGQVQLVLQLFHQVDHLLLNGDIEGGDWLIGDDEARLQSEGAGDADALPLPARELVRVAIDEIGVKPHLLHQLFDILLAFGFIGIDFVDLQRLADDAADGHTRVERGERGLGR